MHSIFKLLLVLLQHYMLLSSLASRRIVGRHLLSAAYLWYKQSILWHSAQIEVPNLKSSKEGEEVICLPPRSLSKKLSKPL